MTRELITKSVWKRLTAAAHRCRGPSAVAVAYFGQGASKLLPLKSGSKLVVDASDAAVKSGQTCPADLIRLQRRGVLIYSVPNLHAKVCVFRGEAFIGSANASRRSAGTLVEAVLRTTDRSLVVDARGFVRGLCRHEQSPELLKRLKRIYRPPRLPPGDGDRRKHRRPSDAPELPRVFIAPLEAETPPSASEKTLNTGYRQAERFREHGRGYYVDHFWWSGQRCPHKVGDVVLQVTRETTGAYLVNPPGNVIHLEDWREGRRLIRFVYVEMPRMRRRNLDRLAHQLGRGAKTRLTRAGLRSAAFSEMILAAWNG